MDTMGPLEVGKGECPQVSKSMQQEKGKKIFVENIQNEKFQKDCGRKHNLKTRLRKKSSGNHKCLWDNVWRLGSHREVEEFNFERK